MNPMVNTILKWEKELEQPNRPLLEYQMYARLFKTKEEKQPKKARAKSVKTRQRCDFPGLVECQTCCNEFV